jgi:ligand-binding sensor domain-containing protein
MRLARSVTVVAVLVASRPAAAANARVLTDLDDANACEPLEGGGLALATGGGLAVVAEDGSTRVLTAIDGLPDTRVWAVSPEGDSLWVGTEAGAARVRLMPTLAVERTVALAADAPVRVVLPTSSGVYFGTWGEGLWRLAPNGGAVQHVSAQVFGTRVAALAEHEGSLFVAYADGPPAKLDAKHDPAVLYQVGAAPTHGQALASVPAADGSTLLLGDLEGLFRLSNGPATSLSSVDTRALAPVGGALLVGTYGSGLLSGSTRGSLRAEAGVPRFVRGVGVLGRLRCAATAEGVFVDASVDGGHAWRKLLLGGPPSNDVTAIAASGERVAVGTFDRGAAIYQRGAFRHVAGLEPSETIEALAWQGQGATERLLLGTAHGLVRVRPDGSAQRLRAADGLPSSTVRAILAISDDRVLVGTDEGLAFVQGDRVTPLAVLPKGAMARPLESPMRATWALAAGDDGTIWIGTTAGLYYGKDGRFRRAAVATGELRDDWVTALAVEGSDVFVGTYSGGVTRLRVGTGRLAASHLGGGYVNPGGLTVLGGELLAATMDGLIVRPKDDDGAAWRPRPGVSPGRDVTAVRKVGDALWVASRRGIGVSRP